MGGWSQYVTVGKKTRLRWSWHTLGLFTECPQRYKWTIIDDLVPLAYLPGVSRGSCIHGALAAYYECLRAGGEADSAEMLALDYISKDPDVDDEDRATAERTVRGYVAWYYPCEVPQRLEVVDIERDVGCDLRKLHPSLARISTPITYDSRVDGVVKLHNHKTFDGLWALEHKSMSALMSSTYDSYRMEGQILGEIASLRSTGIGVRGVLLNALTTAQHPKYDRAFIAVPDNDLVTFARTVHYWQSRIRAVIRRGGPWPRTYACCGRFGLCWFRDLCTYGESVARKFVCRSTLKPGDLVVRREDFRFV